MGRFSFPQWVSPSSFLGICLGTDCQTEATHVATAQPSLPIPIGATHLSAQPGLALLSIAELGSGQRMDGAGIDALPTVTTSIIHPLSHLQWTVGQDGGQAHTRAELGRDQQAVLADPAQPRQMGCQLVGEYRGAFTRGTILGCGNGQGRVAPFLYSARQVPGDGVNGGADHLVEVIPIQAMVGRELWGNAIHNRVG